MNDIRPTRIIELIEDGRFDPIVEDIGRAVLKRIKLKEERKKRQDKLAQRRAKAAEARKPSQPQRQPRKPKT